MGSSEPPCVVELKPSPSCFLMLSVASRDDETGRLFASLAQDKRDLVIRLGMELVSHAEACAHAWTEETKRAEIERLQSLLESARQESTDQIKASEEARRAEVERLQSLLENARQESTDQIKASVRNALTARDALDQSEVMRLRKEVTGLRNVIDTAADKANERCDRLTSEVRDFYEKKLSACQGRLEEACGNRQNSTKKGKRGEEYLLDKLNAIFPEADVEDTHATPGRGDFVLRDKGLVMMIETKNYRRNVQKAEIDKFYRDLEDPGNSDFQCAVLVSLGSGVCSREDFCFEMRGERPILFLHNLEENFDTLRLAVNFFRSVLAAGSHVDLQNKATQDTLKSCAQGMKRGYAKQRGRINKFHSEQLSLVAEQEARAVELFGALGQKL